MRMLIPLTAILLCGAASADPIHARADGAYWHHDSNWLFPEKLGAFTRVGIPQDIAGSRDAQAWYAQGAGNGRIVASVDLVAPDSAAEEPEIDAARESLGTRTAADAAASGGGAREAYLVTRDGERRLVATHRARIGEWRVRIRMEAPADAREALAAFAAFVRAQRWDALCEASMASSASCAAAAGDASSPW